MTSSPFRLVVLASGRGSNLRAIVDAIAQGRLRAEIAGVVSDRPDAAALSVAKEKGLPQLCLPLAGDRSAWNERLREAIASFRPDLVVLAGFMRVLGPRVIAAFPQRIVNVHPSLLPAFPGHDAVRQALRAGVKLTGCTVHYVDEGVDTGPILAQAAVPVLPGDDEAQLHHRIQQIEHRIFSQVIAWIAAGKLGPTSFAFASALPEHAPAWVHPPFDPEWT